MMGGSLLIIRPMPLDAAGVLRNSEHAFNTSGDATRYATNCTADGPAHRTSGPVAHGGPLLSSAHDPLGLSDSGHSKDSEANCGKEYISLHRGCSSLRRIQTRYAREVPC